MFCYMNVLRQNLESFTMVYFYSLSLFVSPTDEALIKGSVWFAYNRKWEEDTDFCTDSREVND